MVNPSGAPRTKYDTFHDVSDAVSEVRELARQLDTRFKLPGGIPVGWDGLIGLIPGVGDLATNAISFYIIFRAADAGCPPSVLMRMGLNVLIDNILDAIPFLGNVFDFFYKSNTKNLALMERYALDPARTARGSRGVVVATLFAVATAIFGAMALAAYLAYSLFKYLSDTGTGTF
ncbi:MAG TPA: DUF4112 domain-containing protein [Bdellovibrionales bacterium]|nr:DUF4112 domain-containing protein [Bdellovibrionales bacterium]